MRDPRTQTERILNSNSLVWSLELAGYVPLLAPEIRNAVISVIVLQLK